MPKYHKTPEHDVLIAVLRQTRESLGLSQNEVSRRLGNRINYMNRVELGRQSIEVVNLLRILDAMKADRKEFFLAYLEALRGLG